MKVLSRLAFFSVIAVVIAACSSGSRSDHLRPFNVNDASILNVDHSRALAIVKLNHTWVATTDFKSRPVCDDKDTFIVVANQPGVGQWLGGDLGCQTLNLSIPNNNPEFVFNPFCKFNRAHIHGDCLNASTLITTNKTMMSRLRPAGEAEVLAVRAQILGLNAQNLELNPLPTPADLDRWYVATAGAPIIMWPLFGAEAIKIIVPDGVKLNGGQIGQNQLFIGRSGMYSDPLCAAISKHGLEALPIKLTGQQLEYAQQCQA